MNLTEDEKRIMEFSGLIEDYNSGKFLLPLKTIARSIRRISELNGWSSYSVVSFKRRMNRESREICKGILPSDMMNFHGFLVVFVLAVRLRKLNKGELK